MKLGIAIPCYSGHIDKLWVLLDALNNQTLLPNKVVVSCSSTNSITVPTTYKYELLIVVSQSYKNASQNRNIAISLLKDMDYISFIDADDIPHYQRNETLAGVIAIYNSDIILHNYMTSPENLARPMTKFACNTKTLERSQYGHIKHIEPDKNINNKIHHSQATVKKAITDIILFNEANIYTGSEDSIFCFNVFSLANIKHTYIYNELSYYNQSHTNKPI